MTQLTKEEKFILCMLQQARARGDSTSALNMYDIGQELNMHPRVVHAIVRVLQQANFIKKEELDFVYLTPNGLALAESLL